MSYTSVVDELRQREVELRAENFASLYRPDLPSIVLLPGGMGSRLLRNVAPYRPGEPYGSGKFYELWLDFARAVTGDLKELAMTDYGEDAGGSPIVASGELSSIVKAYDGVAGFLDGKANFVGLGYDWRRPPDREYLYVRSLLQRIADKVRARGHADPRPRLTLFAHSQGGLVAKLFLNDLVERGEDMSSWCRRLVTCCTPFYGTLSHLSRFYAGVDLVNIVTGGAAAVARIVCTLKGPYILLPAPRAVLLPRLGRLGLARYPVRDAADPSIECDAFDPALGRLPADVRADFLGAAERQFRQIDANLPDAVSERVYHLRSDVTGGSQAFEMTWGRTNGTDDPIGNNGKLGGRHDGTVPFWAARLPATPDANVFDLAGVPHGGAAENPKVLEILWNLLQDKTVPAGPQARVGGPAYGSMGPVRALVEDVQAGLRPVSDLTALPPEDFRTLCGGFILA